MLDERCHGVVSELSSLDNVSWARVFESLHPGAHVAVVVSGPNPSLVSVALRRAGFEFRDTLMVYSGVPILGWKPCFIFRKPAEESTISKQVVRTGTGAINIDGCRVKHASKEDFEAHKAMVDAVKAKGGVRGDSWKNSSDLSGANDVSTAGRWPANVVLVHAPGCKLVGETKVDAPVINRFTDGAKPFGNGAGHPYESIQTGDENGQESIGVYECEETCPAQALNGESGLLVSGNRKKGTVVKGDRTTYQGHESFVTDTEIVGDSGGASRFFSQFECDPTCPIQAIDKQSGIRPSTLAGRADPTTTHANASSQEDANGLFWGNGGGQVYADSGGASRFFSQFECTESCPVATLDDQSGILKNGGHLRNSIGQKTGNNVYDGEWTRVNDTNFAGDSGGASRFFSQFEASPGLRDWLLRLVLPPGGRLLELSLMSEQASTSEPETSV